MLTENSVCAQRFFQDPAVTDDYPKEIVKIMGNSTRQTSDRLHFLRHSKLLFEHPPFGHVIRKYFKVCRDAGLIVDAAARTSHGDRRGVLALPLHFYVLDFFCMGEQLGQ